LTCNRQRFRAPLVRCRGGAGAFFFVCLLCASAAQAQDVTEPSLKAAFVYNFAKFIDWPSDALPAAGSFTACVLGDGRVLEALERTVKGRLLSGRSVSVSRVSVDG